MSVTPEQEYEYWDAKATELRRGQLDAVRGVAAKWAALMTALLGVFGTVAFAGGLQTVDKLGDSYAWTVKGLTSAAAVAAVAAIVMLGLAAGGLRTSVHEGLTSDSVMKMYTKDIRQALCFLNWGRGAACVAAVIVLAGSAIILWAPSAATAPPSILVVTGKGSYCGPLGEANKQLEVGGQPLRGGVASIVVVGKCPG